MAKRTLHELVVQYIAKSGLPDAETVKGWQLTLLGAAIGLSRYFGMPGNCQSETEFHEFSFPLANGLLWLINPEANIEEAEHLHGLTDVVAGVSKYLLDKTESGQVDIDFVIAALIGSAATMAASKTTDNAELIDKRSNFYFDAIIAAINAQAAMYDKELGEMN